MASIRNKSLAKLIAWSKRTYCTERYKCGNSWLKYCTAVFTD